MQRMITIKKRNFLFLFAVSVLIGALLTGGLFTGYFVLTDQIFISSAEYKEYKSQKETFGELAELQALITEKYYVPVDKEKLYEGMYKGLFWGLGDPYSTYLTKSEYEQLMISTTGEYQGVGVTIEPDKTGYINVVAPMDGSPAEKAGVKSGDKILAVDAVKYTGESIDAAAAAMRGEEGSKVTLSVLRGEQNLEFEIRRAKIKMKTVTSKVLPGEIGYVRISSFEEKTAADFEAALHQMEVKQMKGLVIDLRDNPGGVVDAGVAVADQLLPEGIVAYTENRKGEKNYYRSETSATDLPFVILVNKGSASTSEILTAAVKDYEVGTIVGTTTYGKGIIQEIEAFKNGGATKLTVMQYFSPKGNVIHGVGVEPDYTIELTEADYVDGVLSESNDKQLQKALSLLD